MPDPDQICDPDQTITDHPITFAEEAKYIYDDLGRLYQVIDEGKWNWSQPLTEG